MYLVNTTTVTCVRRAANFSASAANATLPLVPSSSSVITTVILARNSIDVSGAIDITIEILGLFVALATLAVGIYFGRLQLQKSNPGWSPFGIQYLPRMMHRRPQYVADNGTPLGHLDRIQQPRPSHVDHDLLPALVHPNLPNAILKTQTATAPQDV
ncbi:hypothetical protein LTR17_005890 [Elasticomyces elasticus]|nr:hypothetical protein LTR17_005890 [Elasticomyces elasticus]